MKPIFRKSLHAIVAATALSLLVVNSAAAHCDAMDGPVITEAQAALAGADVTPLLKWVPAADEGHIRAVFDKTLRVRALGEEAREFADHQLFSTLVRVHRASEGAPFTGIQPAGEIDPAVIAADAALEQGNIDELVGRITRKFEQTARERFAAASNARKQAGESVAAGREFVEAYVHSMSTTWRTSTRPFRQPADTTTAVRWRPGRRTPTDAARTSAGAGVHPGSWLAQRKRAGKIPALSCLRRRGADQCSTSMRRGCVSARLPMVTSRMPSWTRALTSSGLALSGSRN